MALLFYQMKNWEENAIFRQSKDYFFGISNDDIIGTSPIDFTLRWNFQKRTVTTPARVEFHHLTWINRTARIPLLFMIFLDAM